ncbi:hypothetical protein T08_8277 [Trichinella sp. T8]|nr:hypothetical protein T08_8277 [Trichinella sp. T8]
MQNREIPSFIFPSTTGEDQRKLAASIRPHSTILCIYLHSVSSCRIGSLLSAFLMGFTLSTNFLNLCFMTLLRPRSPSDIEVVSTFCRNRPAIFSRVSSVQFVAVHTGVVITVVVTLNSQKREIFCDHEW